MPSAARRITLARIHRWLALSLSPVFVLILLSGIALAFRPIVGDPEPPAPTVDPARVVALLQRVDGAGKAIGAFVAPDGRTMIVGATDGPHAYDLETGRPTAFPPEPKPDLFDYAMRVHKALWFGLGGLVTLATIAMIVLVVLGPIMRRPPRRRTTPLAWHIWGGWVLWPLVALLPLSVVVMKLHAPVVAHRGAPMSLVEVLDTAQRSVDLHHLRGVQRFPFEGAIVVADGAEGPVRWVVDRHGTRPLDSKLSTIGHALHEGTWAGPWSGALNIVAALALLAMLGAGIVSWARKSRSEG